MASESFLRRNPRYREAEWKSRGPREKRPEPGSNLDTFHLMNKQGFSADEAREAATDLKASGMRTGFGGVGIEPDRILTPRERARMRLDSPRQETRTPARTPAGPTDDQRKWAKSFRESQKRPPLRSAAGPEKPLNFSRSAMVEGAKSSGDFINTRNSFNKQSRESRSGMEMNTRGGVVPLSKTAVGPDGLTPYAREKFGAAVEDKAAARDFATGKSTTTTGTTGLVQQDNGARPTQAQDFRREITSKYGSGSNVARTPGQGGGTMTDPLTGKTVPMKSYLAQQSAVQDTKAGTSGVGENRTSNESGDGYFDPKKIRQSMQQRRGRVA